MEPLAAWDRRWTRSLTPVVQVLRFLAGGIRADAPAMVQTR
jgi:hypothetical protein